MTCPMQTYLWDLEMLDHEVENILLSSAGARISVQTKAALIERFTPVVDRMKPVHEYVNQHPDFEYKAACAEAYARLTLHILRLTAHNSRMVEQI